MEAASIIFVLIFFFFFFFICITILYAKYPTIRNTIWYTFFFAGPFILQTGLEHSLYRIVSTTYNDGWYLDWAFTIFFLFPILVVIQVLFASIIRRILVRTSKNFHNTCDTDKYAKPGKLPTAIIIFGIGILLLCIVDFVTWIFLIIPISIDIVLLRILFTSIKDFHNTCDTDKYTKPEKSFKGHCLKHIPKAIKIFIVGIVYIFVFESLTWMVDERDEYRVPECCGESHTVDYETRTYKEKLMDTYLLQTYFLKNTRKKGEFDHFFMIFWTMVLTVISVRAYKSAFREYENDLINAPQIDIMLTIEKLAGENNLNAEAVQEMKNVAPSIIENMSADSRVYFDLVLDGKIPLDDPELMKSAAAIVRGHLKTHPEDMQLVTSAFGENHPILKDLAGTEKNS